MRIEGFARVGVVLGLTAVLLGGCYFSGSSYRAEFSRGEESAAPLAGITELSVATEVGRIRLEAADGAEARIHADIKVRAETEEKAQELAEQVRITAEAVGKTLVVKALKPAGFGHRQLCVDFAITAPAALDLDCTTDVGDILAAGFTGRVRAHTDVGRIDCEGLRAAVDAQTDVGDITIIYASDAPAALNVNAATDVGKIDFTGPEQISAGLTAVANVGDINTSRPILVTGSVKQSLKAALGNGEGKISLRTDVGSIRIR